jgi:hypothetical protein
VGNLYVLGARQRKSMLKAEDEFRAYEAALILRVDSNSGEASTCVEYTSPLEVRASEQASSAFKCASLVDNQLYTCTSTEVLVFAVPDFQRTAYLSLPYFNDLHHVTPTHDHNLLVVSTGLDMVAKITPAGETLALWNVSGEDPWSRFSPDADYRKVESTKPHQSHPNFVFELGKEVWVTRFAQRDAVCLTSPGRRINIEVEKPHDGLLFEDQLYFTTVNGLVVIANVHTLQVERVFDLNEMDGDSNTLLGWCRGLLPLDNRRIWVGFTRVRKTKFTENLLWIKHGFREKEEPTHIALYDLGARHCLQKINLENFGMNVVFGIHSAQ